MGTADQTTTASNSARRARNGHSLCFFISTHALSLLSLARPSFAPLQIAVSYQTIEILQEHGINANDLQKLQGAGYHTVESVRTQLRSTLFFVLFFFSLSRTTPSCFRSSCFRSVLRHPCPACPLCLQIAHATTRKLCEVKGISEAKVLKLKEIVKSMVPMDFKTAADALEDRKSLVTLSTGSTELDKLLEGGIETGSITEVYGEFRTGKTQLCHTLCITCQMALTEGGAEGKAIYLDTEGSFRPARLQAIAERFGLDPAVALENVAYARAHNSEHQMELLKMAAAIMSQVREKFM
jgi:Rad51